MKPIDTLRGCRGVIHVGANSGQEREVYAGLGLRVLWIEPIPEAFDSLMRNIAGFPDQSAVRALVTDRDGTRCALHVASNEGASSSIFPLGRHSEVWPAIVYTRDIMMDTERLPTLLARAGADRNDFDALVVDVQGAELLVLQGAWAILRDFSRIVVEVANFSAYRGGCDLHEVDRFLREAGFEELARRPIGGATTGEAMFDTAYGRL